MGVKLSPQCRTKKLQKVSHTGEMQLLTEFNDSNGQPGAIFRQIFQAIQPAPVDIMKTIFRGFFGPFVGTNKILHTDDPWKCSVGTGSTKVVRTVGFALFLSNTVGYNRSIKYPNIDT